MKTYIVAFLLLSLSATFSAAHPYLIKRLGIEQGLSNNYVISITQDKQGFLWFATEEGLNKFDGTRFITYYKNEQSSPIQSITGNELNEVYADPIQPIIWIATQRAGLNAYNYETQSFSIYQYNPEDPQSLITNDVTHVISSVHPDKGLWVCTYYRGIDYLDHATGKFTHYNKSTIPALPSEQTWTAMETEDGELYIGHVEGGLSILSLNDKSVKHYTHDPQNPNSLPGNDVRSIYKDTNGNIWVGTNKGLALFNPGTGTFTNFHKNPGNLHGALSSYVFSIKQLKDNKLWIATELNGIMILDLQQNQFILPEQIHFEFIREGDDTYSLSNASARYIFQDSFNNVWIGTWGGGINFISNDPPAFNTWSYSPTQQSESSLNNKVVSSICNDEQGRLWIGTDGGGINVFEDGKRVAIHNKESKELMSNSVLCSLKDSENNLWFGTYLGNISYYNTKLKKFQIIELEKHQLVDIRAFYEDKFKNIWIGTNKGIFVLSLANKEVIHHYDTSNSQLPENFVRSITQDNKGRYWIGTFGGGIGIYSPDMQLVKKFNQYEGFCSNTINQIYRSSKGEMWVATGEGLVRFPSTDSFDYQVFQRKEGLPNTHIRAVMEDKNGNIWTSTNTGINCYMSAKKRFYTYDHFNNIPQGSFISGCVTKDHNGLIYFGSINGLCFFNPDIAVNSPQVSPVVITEMRISGRLSNPENNETIIPASDKPIELTHDQNSFSLTFNIQNYSLANQVEYAYMLKGLENFWYTINDQNSITFRNIPPGKYEFLIKARLHNQDWSEEVTSLTIRINPPIWLTWWAKLIYILISISIIYIIIYAYKKKIDIESLYTLEKKNHEQEQELNQERLRFYTNITHELRTPLTLILGPLEDMQKDASLPTKQVQKLSVIHQSALRLLNLINQILEFRKTETQNKKLCVCRGNIAPLIHEIGLKYKELNQKKTISFEIQIEKEEEYLFFDKEIVTIILDNLISNAIKYTEQGQITLSLYCTTRNGVAYTEIKVSDTGYGISAEALPHVFDRYYQESGKHQASGTGIGLALVKNLIELHEGEIRVESAQNEGSTFYISLLTDNIYPNALHADSAEQDEEEEEITDTASEATQSSVMESGKPILLIVEDNEDIQKYIAESFSDSFEVITANNGEEGKQQAHKHIPDIIVSDIMMPVMDGITLCRQLKEDVRTSHIPVILLTAKDSLQDKEEGYQVGADSYLTKPFSASLLRSRIHNLLDTRKKLISQFQQIGTTLGSNSPLNEKRSMITEALSKLDNEFIEKITQLIEENLSSEKIDITYLSDKMCMSGSTLYRKMKALTGLSTNEYIRKIKMQNAERLILEGKYNISEVAYKVGMNSTGYFRQCFKDEFGVSPSDYLKQITQE